VRAAAECGCGFLHLDGAGHSGSGTIVRSAAALAALTRTPLHLVNARAKRPQPGLRPQHVAAIRACAELCSGRLEGDSVGSREFRFRPGPRVGGGSFAWDIGTAGSTTMLALSVLPLGALSTHGLDARITGGVFQDFAPSPFHLARVLLPALATMGIEAELTVERAGYVPGGAGVLHLRVRPCASALRPFESAQRRAIGTIQGVALASGLPGRQVSERMARACEERLCAAGLESEIARREDERGGGPGAALAVWTSGAWFGADRAGARRRRAEAIGKWVAARLLEELASEATVDRHLADMLVPFAALAAGDSVWRTSTRTDHLETSLWLVEPFGARARLEGTSVSVRGIAREPEGAGASTEEGLEDPATPDGGASRS
jgi:RNA 3'-terminal phosphate cyclase (ATP)